MDIVTVHGHPALFHFVKTGGKTDQAALARPRLSHEGYRFPRLDAQVNIVEDIIIRLITEVNVLENNLSLDRRQFDGIGFVLNLGFDIEQLEDTCAGGHSPLELRILHGQFQNRLEETLDIEQEGYENTDSHDAVQHLKAAYDNDDGKGDAGEDLHHGHHERFQLNGADIGIEVRPVDLVKLTEILLLTRKALDDPYAGHIFLELRIDRGDSLPHPDKSPPGVLLPHEYQYGHYGNYHKRD